LKTYTFVERSWLPLFVGQVDVLVRNRLSASVFCYLESSSSKDFSNLFKDVCKFLSAFVAHSSCASFPDESVNWCYGYNTFLSRSRQDLFTPLTASCSIYTPFSRPFFFKNFVLPERIVSMLDEGVSRFLNDFKRSTADIGGLTFCPCEALVHEHSLAPHSKCRSPYPLHRKQHLLDWLALRDNED
jgi:hypothetical protein